MGRHGDSIGHGSNQRHGLGHSDRCSCCDELNSDDHDDADWVCWWLGNSYGDITSYSVDSNIWNSSRNG